MKKPREAKPDNTDQALAAWDRTGWPAEAEPLLRRALEAEPGDGTRETIRKALTGESQETS